MDNWKITPSQLKGRVEIPPSKSQSMRAVLFALLAKGGSTISRLLPSPDVEHMLQAAALLGAKIERDGKECRITGVDGKIDQADDVIQAGNSGLVFRLVGAVAALGNRPVVITGDASIRHRRPISPLLEALCQLGAEAYSTRTEGGAPIVVKGPLQPGHAIMRGEDSQPVSAMLIASAFVKGPIELFVTQAGEKPWVQLTLNWLHRLGIEVEAQNHDYYKLKGNASIEGFSYRVPSDFSSLSYPLLAAILTRSELTIENVDLDEAQGDKILIDHFVHMGAHIDIDRENRRLVVGKTKELKGLRINLDECIDATPLLAVAGCFAEGKTELFGGEIARKKECDRIFAIASELKKMGALIEERNDGLTIYPSPLFGAEVSSHSDHRMALALSVAGMSASGETCIKGVGCVQKSYPSFCEQMQKLGGNIQCL